ncbi:Tim44 domain-containing protein [Candidatus Dojkabacteria bacterium]|nr:Tim44 domain-containing protein [Candidatus Dojkabacteria bacterium]
MNSLRSKLRKFLQYFATAFLLLFFCTTSVLARAGGGESFGDGGFDSGGSSSFDFGGSSSNTNYSSTSNFGGGNLIPLIIIIVILVIIASGRRRGGVSTDTTSGTPNTPDHKSQSIEEIQQNLTSLKKIDPKFDEQKFKTHSKKVFMAVQKGWTERDQEICRPFMAEEVYQSHQMQIDSMKESKVINVLENIVVGSTAIARIDLGEEYHKIAVKIRASMKDYKVNEEDPNKVVEGTKAQTPPFTEYWIFIRRSNLKTKIKDGIFDRKCPNCGAPIHVSVSGICKYCDANVVNGDYDWVLSEIIQKSEWME